MGERNLLRALAGAAQGDGSVLGQFFERIPTGIYFDHPVKGCTYANQALLDLFGMEWSAFEGSGWTLCVDPNEVPRLRREIERYEYALDRFDVTYRIFRAVDGEERWVHAVVDPLLDEQGAHIGSVGVVHDVTEERQLALRVSHTQSLEAIGQLAGRVAHDFNNLLGVVLTSIDLLEVSAPEQQTMFIDTIRGAIEHSSQITRQLLTLAGSSTEEPGNLLLDAELVTIEPLLSRVCGERVQLTSDLDAPGAVIALTRSQIGQIAVNLVANARDAMAGRGSVWISTHVHDRGLVLSVKDSGEGMDEATLRRAREPFFTTKGQGRGTGLGLAIVNDIIEHVLGKLHIESTPGHGTTVSVHLPLVLDPSDSQSVEVRGPSRRGAGERMLIVDDNDALRQSLSYAAALQGYDVSRAADLTEAREVVAQAVPQIVVCDVLLPDGVGTELLAEVRASHPDVPFIFITGNQAGELGDVRKAGRTQVLEKPFSIEALMWAADVLLRPSDDEG